MRLVEEYFSSFMAGNLRREFDILRLRIAGTITGNLSNFDEAVVLGTSKFCDNYASDGGDRVVIRDPVESRKDPETTLLLQILDHHQAFHS